MFRQLIECDWVGVAIVLAWGCVSILAMQEGVCDLMVFAERETLLKPPGPTALSKGVTKSWKSASVLVELIMIPVLAAAFVAWETYLDDKAMLPIKLFKRPLVVYASSCLPPDVG